MREGIVSKPVSAQTWGMGAGPAVEGAAGPCEKCGGAIIGRHRLYREYYEDGVFGEVRLHVDCADAWIGARLAEWAAMGTRTRRAYPVELAMDEIKLLIDALSFWRRRCAGKHGRMRSHGFTTEEIEWRQQGELALEVLTVLKSLRDREQ